MFIFMEYCNEGTLEEMSKLGLSEGPIRKYTKELVIAVDYLHENGIVHRDIKGNLLTLHVYRPTYSRSS